MVAAEGGRIDGHTGGHRWQSMDHSPLPRTSPRLCSRAGGTMDPNELAKVLKERDDRVREERRRTIMWFLYAVIPAIILGVAYIVSFMRLL